MPIQAVVFRVQNNVPQQIQDWVSGMRNHPGSLIGISLVWTVLFLGYRLIRGLQGHSKRPVIAKEDIVYQENFASGASQKNFLTRIGGAQNCLRLIVTKDLLWVTSWFPFSLISGSYDLEQVIPLAKINSLETDSSLGQQGLLLAYADAQGNQRALRLRSRHLEQFVQALQSGAAPPSSGTPGLSLVSGPPTLSLRAAFRKYWHHLSVLGLFATLIQVGGKYLHLSFVLVVPLFFACTAYGFYPLYTRRVPPSFMFLIGAFWLGGAIVSTIIMSLISMVLT